ncbi:MAG: alanine racemase [Chlamydiales bacterium]
MPSCSQLFIDLNQIHQNLNAIEKKKVQVMPMVKANGYGTDALLLSRFLQSCHVPFVGVSHVEEGVYLRKEGISLPIFVINAPPFEAEKVVRYRLEAAISSFEEAKALNRAAKQAPINVHLFINTGMNRFGASCEKALSLAQYIQSARSLKMEGVMTHLATTDSSAFKQIARFKNVIDHLSSLPRWIHVAKSGTVDFNPPFCNLARIGLGLFDKALCLHSHLVTITSGKKGERVGYDGTFLIEKKEAKIGVVPLGYHDGIHRHYAGKGYVLIHGKKAPMIGQICMDFMMVDLTQIPEARVGDLVVFFDSTHSVQRFAEWGNTNVREVIACLGPRIQRIFIKTEDNDESSPTRLQSSFQSLKKESIAQ